MTDGLRYHSLDYYVAGQMFCSHEDKRLSRLFSRPIADIPLTSLCTLSLREDHELVRECHMWKNLVAEFTQHHDLLAKLRNTGSEKLVWEGICPYDLFWGRCDEGHGEN